MSEGKLRVEVPHWQVIRMRYEHPNRSPVMGIGVPVATWVRDPREAESKWFLVIYHYNGEHYCTEAVKYCDSAEECLEFFKTFLHIRDEDLSG